MKSASQWMRELVDVVCDFNLRAVPLAIFRAQIEAVALQIQVDTLEDCFALICPHCREGKSKVIETSGTNFLHRFEEAAPKFCRASALRVRVRMIKPIELAPIERAPEASAPSARVE